MSDELAAKMRAKISGSKIENFVESIQVDGLNLIVTASLDYIDLDHPRREKLQNLIEKVWREESGFQFGQVRMQLAQSAPAPPPAPTAAVIQPPVPPAPQTAAAIPQIEVGQQAAPEPQPTPQVETATESASPYSTDFGADSPSRFAAFKSFASNSQQAAQSVAGFGNHTTYRQERSAASLVITYGVFFRWIVNIATIVVAIPIIGGALFGIVMAVLGGSLSEIMLAALTFVIAVVGVVGFWFALSLLGAFYIVFGGIMRALADISDAVSGSHPENVQR
ncbi:hypothetical protein LOC67_00950 [Stieleria sp. JC731]|uniref:hypothetical protein n=1 Tax=Pirellulaceae TaxID=2691357 RepID=UPI001E33353D|nr:hypothetical protein [Stieleria sp. JC731]MCC9599108.1 hypothetical protein [Stieleria sp. JC731]